MLIRLKKLKDAAKCTCCLRSEWQHRVIERLCITLLFFSRSSAAVAYFSCHITCLSTASSGNGRRENPAHVLIVSLLAEKMKFWLKPWRKSKQEPGARSLSHYFGQNSGAFAGSAADVFPRKLFQFGEHQAVVPVRAQPALCAFFYQESTQF